MTSHGSTHQKACLISKPVYFNFFKTLAQSDPILSLRWERYLCTCLPSVGSLQPVTTPESTSGEEVFLNLFSYLDKRLSLLTTQRFYYARGITKPWQNLIWRGAQVMQYFPNLIYLR